ncbi:MAG: putative serine protease, subtilase family, partial [Pseudarthrobacter sp.]|nr:putative serine protease, subtilase family [Pseudarthrobacter sp.]
MSSYLRARAFGTVGIAAIAALVIGGMTALPARADNNEIRPVVPHSLSATVEVATDQFIVGIKEKAGPAAAALAREAASDAGAKTGVTANSLRQTSTGAQVVRTDRALTTSEAEGFLSALQADPDVAYAEPDLIMQPASVEPNDGLYPLQWDLWEDQGGIRAPGAWSVSRGEGTVVAVVDTGILAHSELDSNVLPGYDMMSSAAAARDGDGRDPDPTDEGDWVSAGQCTGGDPAGVSSWHGTHVAGTIAAVANNGTGVTGVAPEAKILPLRALGPCGGYTSDIADSIVWAAGGVVTGAPANANPARVINLSLGGISACSATYQNAINFAYNSGATVVVAAGNSNRPAADSSPANCQNVISVGASSRTGARAPYSNYGSAVDVTAPGGDMSFNTWNGILSTSNFGTTSAEEEAYEFQQGTSMAAPHVAGIAALILSELGEQTSPAMVENRIKVSTRPLGGSCLFYGCGVGLVDATAALAKLSPAAVTFSDVDGTANDTYTIPSSKGFQYSLNGNVASAGTYPGNGTVTVVAKILPGFSLAEGSVTEWTHTFEGAAAPVDVSGPVVVSSSVSPTSFNLADGPAVVKVSLRVTDQTGTDAPV